MQKGSFLNTILRSEKTIFSLQDMALMWGLPNTNATLVRLGYYVKRGDLIRLRRGLYAKNKQYNKLELATRVYTPSYISFETVLAGEGLIFQFQTNIQAASYLTREIEIDGQTYHYQKLRDSIITNAIGVEDEGQLSIATRERAFLDTLYTNKNYHFDNLRGLDWDKVFAILPIYENKRMVKIVKELFEESKK